MRQRVSEAAGRASEEAERASEAAERASKAAERASQVTENASEAAERADRITKEWNGSKNEDDEGNGETKTKMMKETGKKTRYHRSSSPVV